MAMTRSPAIYARISEADPSFDKVSAQVAAVKKHFSGTYSDVPDELVFRDTGSATTGAARPGWNALLAAIDSGRVAIVLATEEERLTRGAKTDRADLFAACLESKAKWHTIRDGLLDPADDEAEFFSDFRDALGRREIRRKTSRQLARYRAALDKGEPLWGNRPFGFSADESTNLWTKNHDSEAPEVLWAFETIAKGGSIYSIVKTWNEKRIFTTSAGQERKRRNGTGTTTVSGLWSYAAVQNLLKNPRYTGLLEHRGSLTEGAWEPIVDRELFETVQAVLSDPTRRTSTGTKPTHLLSGIALCSCGATMRSGAGNGEPVYRCRRASEGASVVGGHASIATRLLDPVARGAVVDALLMGPSKILPQDDVDLSPLENELSKVRAARASLVNLIAQGLLNEAEAARALRELKQRESAAEEKRAALIRTSATASMLHGLKKEIFVGGRADFTAAVKARGALEERFDGLPLAQKQQLVRALVEVTVKPGRGTKRVEVEHLVVDSLNEDGDS